ncbi:MAG: single-stranded-DNA-specific exonuclease RecJ [Candidatus Saccharimonadales bacterium]
MKIASLVADILVQRGITDAAAQARFLQPAYTDLHDPFLLADMATAVERIQQAIEKEESIVVYGDYDIDGLTATTLLLDGLGAMGAKISAYIPDRFEEGYGINTAALKKLQRQGADLIITVDCGSTSHAPLEWAAAHNLEVIVTDHHTLTDTLPPAVAMINPKRADNRYPFTDLAGVGVAFKLVQGLQQRGLLPEGREKWLLDLVALGTVCDVVGLVGENRILVSYGLKVFAQTPRMGLQALLAVAGVERDRVDTYHFGFVLGPRMNAAGRLEHAKLALSLLMATDKGEAREIAERLDRLNAERRRQQDEIMALALVEAEKYRDDPVLVLSHPDWNHGIVGIVAAKLMERFAKPTIVMQEMGEETKGSARSLGSFSVVEGMRSADKLLLKYGGHHVAAGCSLKTTDVAAFRQQLNDFFRAGEYGDLRPQPRTDVSLSDLSMMSESMRQELEQLAPFGMGNPKPQLHLPAARLLRVQTVGSDRRHVKLQLSDGERYLDGIGFGLAEAVGEIGEQADVWFELDENEFRGQRNLQALIKAVQSCKD